KITHGCWHTTRRHAIRHQQAHLKSPRLGDSRPGSSTEVFNAIVYLLLLRSETYTLPIGITLRTLGQRLCFARPADDVAYRAEATDVRLKLHNLPPFARL